MAKLRSYKLLCPIARALDRIGDRWTLLILRDLHAGPARFTDLQRGLTGIAANLLTERLGKLVLDGLAEKQEGAHGAALYKLTEIGSKTNTILFELAMFGGHFALEGDVVEPGNLRTVAFTMTAAAQRVVTRDMAFTAAFIVDNEDMALEVEDGKAEMLYATATTPDLTFKTSYSALLSVSENELEIDKFVSDESELIIHTSGKEAEFFQLMTAVLVLFRHEP